jgi:hypothetical protein
LVTVAGRLPQSGTAILVWRACLTKEQLVIVFYSDEEWRKKIICTNPGRSGEDCLSGAKMLDYIRDGRTPSRFSISGSLCLCRQRLLYL